MTVGCALQNNKAVDTSKVRASGKVWVWKVIAPFPKAGVGGEGEGKPVEEGRSPVLLSPTATARDSGFVAEQ